MTPYFTRRHAAILLGLSATLAHAQTGAKFEEVKVFAEKLGRNTLETTSSVSVVTGEDINARGITSLAEILDSIANASMTENGQFSLRGVSSGGVDGNEFNSQTATVFIDGVAQDRVGLHYGMRDLFDISQVEVLRGPQSTSQGRNALAGAVLISTNNPGDNWDSHVRLNYGVYDGGANTGNQFYGTAFASGGPITDSVGARIVLQDRHSDGYLAQRDTGDKRYGQSDQQMARAKVSWQPAGLPDFSALLSMSYGESQLPPTKYYLRPSSEAYTSESNTEEVYKATLRAMSLNLDYQLNDHLSLSSISSGLRNTNYTLYDTDYSRDADSYYDLRSDNRNHSQEFRLNFRYERVRGVAGVYYGVFDDGYTSIFGDDIYPIIPVPPFSDFSYAEADYAFSRSDNIENTAIFAEADIDLSQRLTLTLGLRYDREDRSQKLPFTITHADAYTCLNSDCSTTLPPLDVTQLVIASGLFPESGQQSGDASYDAWLPKVALRYALSEQLGVFFVVNQAYRAGGADVLFSTGEVKEYEPEYTNNAELGFRYQSADARYTASSNIYYTEWQDQQVQVLTEAGDDSYRDNAANSELYGAELELQAQLSDRVSAYLALAYAHTEFSDFVTSGREYTGNEFARSPSATGSVGLSWRHPSGWHAAANLDHTGEFYSFADNEANSLNEARTLFHARAGYENANFAVQLIGRNLSNKEYTSFSQLWEKQSNRYGRTEDGLLVTHGAPRSIALQVDLYW